MEVGIMVWNDIKEKALEKMARVANGCAEAIDGAVADVMEAVDYRQRIKDAEEQLDQLYYDTGYKVIEELGQFPEEIQRAQELKAEIEECERALAERKGVRVCPECGAEMSVNAAYCSECGAELEDD